AGNLAVNGPFNWSAGILTGAGSFATSGTSTLSGSVVLDGRAWTQGATASISGVSGRLNMQNGAVVTNSAGGVFNLDGTDGNPVLYIGGAGVAFNNAGTFNKSAGSGALQNINGVTFNNTGTANVAAGTLQLLAGGTDTNGQYV